MIGLGGGIIVDDDGVLFVDFCGSDCLDGGITLCNGDGVEVFFAR